MNYLHESRFSWHYETNTKHKNQLDAKANKTAAAIQNQ